MATSASAKGEIRWTKAWKLAVENVKANVPHSPGVYRIRAFADQSAQAIPRCQGADPEGVLHLGQSGDLRTRLIAFLKSANQGKKLHSAGCEFWDSGFGNRFSPEALFFDFVSTSSKKEALAIELAQHLEYRRIYLDKPPLDSNVGQREKELAES